MPTLLLADPAAQSEPWFVSGSIGAAAIGAIVYLIRFYTGEMSRVVNELKEAIAAKDLQIIALSEKFDATINRISERSEKMFREMREENARTVEQMFAMSKDTIEAMEHQSQSLNELKTAMQTISARLDALDKPARRPPGRGEQT